MWVVKEMIPCLSLVWVVSLRVHFLWVVRAVNVKVSCLLLVWVNCYRIVILLWMWLVTEMLCCSSLSVFDFKVSLLLVASAVC